MFVHRVIRNLIIRRISHDVCPLTKLVNLGVRSWHAVGRHEPHAERHRLFAKMSCRLKENHRKMLKAFVGNVRLFLW